MWKTLSPIVKRIPMVKAAIGVSKLGNRKLSISFADSFFQKFGEPDFAVIQAGEDEFFGLVRIEFLAPETDGLAQFNERVLVEEDDYEAEVEQDTTTHFAVMALAKGGARVFLPVFDGLPEGARGLAPCKIQEEGERHLVLALPLLEWAGATSPMLALPPPSQPPTPPRQDPDLIEGKFDWVGYLRKKGHAIKFLSMDRIQIDGEVVNHRQIISSVNAYRKLSELPELAEGDVFK